MLAAGLPVSPADMRGNKTEKEESELEQLSQKRDEIEKRQRELERRISVLIHQGLPADPATDQPGVPAVDDLQLLLLTTSYPRLQENFSQIRSSIRELHQSVSELASRSAPLVALVRRLDTILGRLSELRRVSEGILELRSIVVELQKSKELVEIRPELAQRELRSSVEKISAARALRDSLKGEHEEVAETLATLKTFETEIQHRVREGFSSAIAAGAGDTEGGVPVREWVTLLSYLELDREGFRRYIQYVRQQLGTAAETTIRGMRQKRNSSGSHAAALTEFFSAVADSVGQHQQSLGDHFSERDTALFLRALQEEADMHACSILDSFAEVHRDTLATDTEEPGSKAASDRERIAKIDSALDEISLLSLRQMQCDRYIRGLWRTSVVETQKQETMVPSDQKEDEECTPAEGLLMTTESMKRIQDLRNSAINLERQLLLHANNVAVEADEIPWKTAFQEGVLTSTLVEDCFYVFARVIGRSAASGDVFSLCAVVNHVASFIANDFRGCLLDLGQSAMRRYELWAAGGQQRSFDSFSFLDYLTLDERRSLDAPGGPLRHIGSALSLPHALSNATQAALNVESLAQKALLDFDEHFQESEEDKHGSQSRARTMLIHSIHVLRNTAVDLRSAQKELGEAMNAVLQTRLAPEVSRLPLPTYDIPAGGAAGGAEWTTASPGAEALNSQLQGLLNHLEAVLLPQAFEEVSSLLLARLTSDIERLTIFPGDRSESGSYSLLGALQWDTDVRAISSVCSKCAMARRHFRRLHDIGEFLTVDQIEDLDDICGPHSGRHWKLSREEIRKVFAARRDLDQVAVNRFFEQRHFIGETSAADF